METFFAPNSEPKTGSEKREDPLDIHGYGDIRRLKFFQKMPDPPVVVFGRINLFHNRLIPVQKPVYAHSGNDIGCPIHIISRKRY